MTFIRFFHTSGSVFSNPNHRLYRLVNWDRIEAGEYALVDPVDTGQILYLTEPDYIILVRQSLNSNHRPIVLARPTDKRPSTSSSSTEDIPKNSPPEWFLGRRISKGPINRRYKTLFHWVPTVTRRFGEKEQKENLAVVSARNVRPLFMLWAIHLHMKISGLGSGPKFRSEMLIFTSYLIRILETQGVGALVVRLKVMLFALHSYVAGKPLKTTHPLGMRVRLRNGLPLIFPLAVRMAIRAKNLSVIRLWSSVLFVYKSLESEHKAPDFVGVAEVFKPSADFHFLETRFFCFLQQEAKTWLSSLGFSFSNISLAPDELFMAVSAGANHKCSMASYNLDTLYWIFRGWKDSPLRAYMDAVGAAPMIKLFESYGVEMLKFVLDDEWEDAWHRSSIEGSSVTYDEEQLAEYFPSQAVMVAAKGQQRRSVRPKGGKLSLIREAAGKVRIIAIPDAWTQTVLKPLHNVFFDILKAIPSDGTFDQQSCITSFAEQGHSEIFSYDLKAATDTIPLQLYQGLLEVLFGTELSLAWTSLLRDRTWALPSWESTSQTTGKVTMTPLYYVDEAGCKHRSISYGRGQPMGALSSWGALAVLHHFVVQYAAFLVDMYPYYDYRVLGDDIVIAGRAVARSYLDVCSYLGITVGLVKSFESSNGFANFAGQSYLGSSNISPISFKQELAANDGFARLGLVIQAIRRKWIKLDSNGFFQQCLRYMLPPLYVLQIEASRKRGEVHEAAVTCSSLIFRSFLEGDLVSYESQIEGLTIETVSSGMLFPGLRLFCVRLEQLALLSPVTDWSGRELLGRFILKQLDRIEQLLEARLEECEKVSPPYGFIRFNWPQQVMCRGESIDLSFSLPLFERVSDWATEVVDSMVLGLNNIRVLCSGLRLELPIQIEEGTLYDLLIGYRRLLLLEKEITSKSLTGVGIIFDQDAEDKKISNTLLHENVLLAADLSELDRLGVKDHLFDDSLGLNLVRIRQAISLAVLAHQTHSIDK